MLQGLILTEQTVRCAVRILSETDGKKTVFTSEGRLSRLQGGVRLTYPMENSLVTLETGEEGVSMRREGDVCLRLRFCAGVCTAGEIGLSRDTAGKVSVFSAKVESFLTEENVELKKLTILLEYVLSFPGGADEAVKLRLTAERK